VDLDAPIKFVRRLLGVLGWGGGEREAPLSASPRHHALAETASPLAGMLADGRLEPVLQVIVQVAARVTGAAAAVVVVDAVGRVERFAGEGIDGCMRDTLLRPDLLTALLARLRAIGRPVGPEDLDRATGRTLAAVAPNGFLAFPLGESVSGLLVVLEPMAGVGFEEDAVAGAALLAMLGAATMGAAQRITVLREGHEELRRLVGEALAHRDQELRRTARALHEGIGQRLAAVNAQLQALAPLLEEGTAGARARLQDARALVEQTLGEVRELAQELRPSVLEDFGYVQALRWYLGRLQERARVPLSLEVEGAETRLPGELEGALYRATEEALGAVVRREEAAMPVRVRYRREPTRVSVEIAGRPPERSSLVAIRERLRPFGGDVHVSREPEGFALELPMVN
jgi:signal transduction histidine kinase